MIRNWDHFVNQEKVEHVFLQEVVETKTGCFELVCSPVDVMKGLPFDCPVPVWGGVEDFQVSPKGTEISYVVLENKAASKMAWTTNRNIYTAPIERRVAETADSKDAAGLSVGKPQCRTGDNAGVDHHPVYSPDGNFLVYLSMERDQYESDLNRLFLLNLLDGTRTRLAPSWDLSPDAVVWSSDSSALYLCTAHNAVGKLFRLPLSTPTALPQEILSHGNTVGLAVTTSRLLFSQSSLQAPAEVFSASPDGSQLQQLTFHNKTQVEELNLGRSESLTFKGGADDDVQAWFLYPGGFEEDKTYPLAVVIHGGPQGCIDDSWHWRWNIQSFASHGYAVLCVNFHGSSSFGQAFMDSIRGDWGGKPFEDIMKGVDYALERFPWIDKERMGALGGSYGGYMVNWINGHTDRFKCLISHAGPVNMEAMYYNTEELFFAEWEMMGKPWDSEQYKKWSPLEHATNWKTATLVIHGGKDYRVCDVEGIATFTALQRLGVESEFLYFPTENHWVQSSANSMLWYNEVLAWLDRFLKE